MDEYITMFDVLTEEERIETCMFGLSIGFEYVLDNDGFFSEGKDVVIEKTAKWASEYLKIPYETAFSEVKNTVEKCIDEHEKKVGKNGHK